MEFIEKLRNNPIFMRDRLIRRKPEKGRKFKFPSWGVYLIILLFAPFVGLILFINFKIHPNVKGIEILPLIIKSMRNCFAVSIVLQFIFFSYRGCEEGCRLMFNDEIYDYAQEHLESGMNQKDILLGYVMSAFYATAEELTMFLTFFVILGLAMGYNIPGLFLTYLFTLLFIAYFTLIGVKNSCLVETFKKAMEKSTQQITIMCLVNFAPLIVLSLIGSKYYMFLLLFGPIAAFNPLFSAACTIMLSLTPDLLSMDTIIIFLFLMCSFGIFVLYIRSLFNDILEIKDSVSVDEMFQVKNHV